MQYGLISDIHGNLAALESVWGELSKDGLTTEVVLNAGDNVGYGASPEGCVEFLRAHPNVLTVQGNYDKNIAHFPQKEAEYRKKWGKVRPEKYEALRRDSGAISDDTRTWLNDLPKERELVLEGVRILLTHYAPGSKEGLGRWTPDERLRKLAEQTQAQVVVCGHTHSPFVRNAGSVLYINPGTVGRSTFGGPCYGLLTLEPGQPPSAQLRQLKRGDS